MSKPSVTIVAVTSVALFFLYLYGMSKLGNKKDLNISNKELDNYFVSNNEPLYVTDDQETIIGGTRKRKKRKRGSKKYLKINNYIII